MVIRRGDIYYADLRPVVGSEQGWCPPGTYYTKRYGKQAQPDSDCAAITSRMSKAKLPTHVVIDSRCCSIVKDSVVLLEQLRTIDKQRLREKVCHLEEDMIRQIDEALRVSLDITRT